jgi:hypothetical protein
MIFTGGKPDAILNTMGGKNGEEIKKSCCNGDGLLLCLQKPEDRSMRHSIYRQSAIPVGHRFVDQ